MSLTMIASGVLVFLLLLVAAIIIKIRRPQKLKVDKFIEQWKVLQDYCHDKSTWPEAIKSADKLLESALKKKKFNGKNMGEKLVAAQRLFSNNDSVWFAHNLNKKLRDKPSTTLKEQDVKNALVGFRQALKDVGALPSSDSKDGK